MRIYNNNISVGDTVVAIEHGFDYSPYVNRGGTHNYKSGTHNYKSGDTGIVVGENDDSCFTVRFRNGVRVPGCWSVKFKKVEGERHDTKVWATRRL